jgi:NTP pyrophosphatase (non-canonical NTP hydrolase)
MNIELEKILNEISELNHLDGKKFLERFLKYNEEYGEFSAEVCKLIGITQKPYDEDHLIEEMADAIQNQFSVYLNVCEIGKFSIEEVFKKIIVKNQKWRECYPKYTNKQTKIHSLILLKIRESNVVYVDGYTVKDNVKNPQISNYTT